MGGKNKGFFNQVTGGAFTGAKRDNSYELSNPAKAAEAQTLARQQAIASGQMPSIGQMAFQQNLQDANQMALSQAATAQGVNPALAFRSAQMAGQQNNAQAAMQGAMMQEQERRAADQQIASMVAAQRGVAANMAGANLQSEQGYRQGNLGMLGSLGNMGATYAGMKKKE